jgi:hypothetical protein
MSQPYLLDPVLHCTLTLTAQITWLPTASLIADMSTWLVSAGRSWHAGWHHSTDSLQRPDRPGEQQVSFLGTCSGRAACLGLARPAIAVCRDLVKQLPVHFSMRY